MSTTNPWDMDDDPSGIFDFIMVVFILIGLIIAVRSCDFNSPPKNTPAKISKVSKVYHYKAPPVFSGKRYAGKHWGRDKTWRSMGKYQMVAAMAILETKKNKDGSFCFACSKNIVHTIINRAAFDNESTRLEDHVSKSIYQPVIEPYQYKVLSRYVGTKQHRELSKIAFQRHKGHIKDKVKGATHYLVHPHVMVSLQKKQPCKYWSWGPFKCKGKPGVNWTGYNPETKQYRNQVHSDQDHVFLAPKGNDL